jgi:hypothetical protein
MNKEIIKDEIKWLLEAINEQYEAIHGFGDKIPQIEFDILMENIRKFYENMHLLQRLNDRFASPEKITTAATSTGIKHTATESGGGLKKQKPDNKQTDEIPDPVSMIITTNPEPAEVKIDSPDEPEQESRQKSPIQFKPSGSPLIRPETSSSSKKSAKSLEIDLFASEEPVFNIKLKEAREKTLGPKSQPERIENLKTAISINEKFMFINELFDGNLREYNETIETLNGFKNLDQAADFLDLMRKKNFWNTGSNGFAKLKELVERRF